MARSSRRLAALAALALVLGAAACDPSPPGSPPASASPSATAGYGARYVLPAAMCDAIDLGALRQLYPVEESDDPLRVNTEDHCDIALHNGPRTLGVSVYVLLQDEDLLRMDPTLTEQQYEGQLERAMYPPSEIDGVGSGAFWYGDGNNEMWLEGYDGNLNLRLYVFTLSSTDPLDADMPERLATVATGILAALRP